MWHVGQDTYSSERFQSQDDAEARLQQLTSGTHAVCLFGPKQRELAVHSSYGPQHPISRGGGTFGRLGVVGFGWAGLDLWSGLVWSGTPRFVCVKFIYGPKIPKKGPKTERLRKNLLKKQKMQKEAILASEGKV